MGRGAGGGTRRGTTRLDTLNRAGRPERARLVRAGA